MAEVSSAITLGILAGGGGTRLGGRDKGLIEIGDRCLVDYLMRRLSPNCEACLISANRHRGDYAARGVPVLADEVGGAELAGPLAAVITLLRHTRTPWLQLVPCDAPLLPPDLPCRLRHTASEAGCRVVVPAADGRDQWACALVATACLPELETLFEDGSRGLGRAFAGLGTARLDCTGDDAAFLNVNTPEDLAALSKRLGGT